MIDLIKKAFDKFGHIPTLAEVNSLEDSPGSVSYTHLRAHETVLDLVCRLLLEKKKTHNDDKIRKASYIQLHSLRTH